MSIQTAEILAHYDLGIVKDVQSLGNAGGFSGARLWKVNCDRGLFCLRQWPAAATNNPQCDLEWIHSILLTAGLNEIAVPVPLPTRQKQTLISRQGRAWELAPWMPGHADFNNAESTIQLARLRNAITALANFHECTREFNLMLQSPSVGQRFEQLRSSENVIEQVRFHLGRSPTLAIKQLAEELVPRIAHAVKMLIEPFAQFSTKRILLGVAIRDIHHDHVLFDGEEITGIVDFGSAQIDTHCLDIARLTGSLRINGNPPWEETFEIYSNIRKFTDIEIQLIGLLDQCNLALGSLNWLNWILVEQKQFEDMNAIEKRLAGFANRLNA